MTWNLNSCSTSHTNVTWLVYFGVVLFGSLCKAIRKTRGVLLKACVYLSSSVLRVHFCNSGGFGAGFSWMSSFHGYHFTFRTEVCLTSRLDDLTKYETYFKWIYIFLFHFNGGLCWCGWLCMAAVPHGLYLASGFGIVGVSLNICMTSVFLQTWSIVREIENILKK